MSGQFHQIYMNRNLRRLEKTASKKSRLIIGLMSGTSMDGLDIALCKFTGHGLNTRFTLLEFTTIPYTAETRARIAAVFARPEVSFEKLCILNPWIALLHAQMINKCLKKWKYSAARIDAIASHGQTVFHSPAFLHPQEKINATFQIGDGDHLAVATGILTISDFRQKHIAAGGEGAPLAVYGDYLLLSHKTENRILLNIGGIGNFTYLPAGHQAKKVFVTDTGPGNEAQNRLLSRYGRRFGAGTVVFRDGEPATEAFLLQEGRVRLLKQAGRLERSLRVVRPGDLFGESALVRGATRSSTALALDDVVALAFDHATFEQVLATSPEVSGRVLRQLMRRLRDAEDQIEILMLRDAQSKVVVALIKFAQQEQALALADGAREAPAQVSLALSPLELSAQVGLDVDTVKRIVAQLRETGHVRIQDERVEVPNLESLRDLYSLLGIKDQLRGQAPSGNRARFR